MASSRGSASLHMVKQERSERAPPLIPPPPLSTQYKAESMEAKRQYMREREPSPPDPHLPFPCIIHYAGGLAVETLKQQYMRERDPCPLTPFPPSPPSPPSVLHYAGGLEVGMLKQQMMRARDENERQAREDLQKIAVSVSGKYKVSVIAGQGRGCYKELRSEGAVENLQKIAASVTGKYKVGGWVGGRELQGRRVGGSVAGWWAGGWKDRRTEWGSGGYCR